MTATMSKIMDEHTHRIAFQGFRQVYIVACEGTDRIKIGISEDARKRIKSLQYSSPEKLILICAIRRIAREAFDVEQEFIARNSAARVYGEWFDMDVDEALKFLSEIILAKIQEAKEHYIELTKP